MTATGVSDHVRDVYISVMTKLKTCIGCALRGVFITASIMQGDNERIMTLIKNN